MNTPEYAWLNTLVPWGDANCHISSMAFKYGVSVFEGIRAYWNPTTEKLYLWQPSEHLERLLFSQHFMQFNQPIQPDAALNAICELLSANSTQTNVHITVTAFLPDHGQPHDRTKPSLAITSVERHDYDTTGLSAQTSTWRKPPENAFPPRVKANGNYLVARLAGLQATNDGYDTAILLNDFGRVAEGPSMCFFMVRDGVAITPDRQSGILESITRDTVIILLGELGIPVQERPIDRSELYSASEAFFCGTGWQIAPIRSIDRFDLSNSVQKPITSALAKRFSEITMGDNQAHPEWRYEVDKTKLNPR